VTLDTFIPQNFDASIEEDVGFADPLEQALTLMKKAMMSKILEMAIGIDTQTYATMLKQHFKPTCYQQYTAFAMLPSVYMAESWKSFSPITIIFIPNKMHLSII
jgi:hypothetical protein